ncbi:MAG: transglycosylase SLT domain-containing protein [Candidatus Tectomicrobia bacterium]|nr:transglycosylase SLT domain-containing protein [Candidatus Tectomicrobia bacterium]
MALSPRRPCTHGVRWNGYRGGFWLVLALWLFIVCSVVLLPKSGWALERYLLIPPLASVPPVLEAIPHTQDVSPGAPVVSSAAWHGDLLQILNRPARFNPAARPPLPQPVEVNAILDTVLPHFDVEPATLSATFRQELCQRVYLYTARYRKDVQAMLLRADRYLPMIKRVLQQKGVPTYYAYVPLVESAFRTDVQHPDSGAGGLWQLLDSTARMYGLEVSEASDERFDPVRATPAAASYLQTLHKQFGAQSPLYVLAAYNWLFRT